MSAAANGGQPCDVVFTGARVIDPETGLDGVRDVGVTGGTITAVSDTPMAGRRTIDVSGMVLAPGFIDLHSHAQSRTGLLLQAMDGVTTALELEAGAASVSAALADAEQDGRPVNYGFSASWLLSRMMLFDDAPLADPMTMFGSNHDRPLWKAPASGRDVDRLLDHVAGEVDSGGIGIGVLVGYAPETGTAEYFALARRAEDLGTPTFTHTRYISTLEPHTSLEAALEVIAASAGTGAHMHMCHINSTSNRMIDEIAEAIARAQATGVKVTTEAYPYGSGSTVIGADFLAPEKLPRMGVTPDRLRYLPTGEIVADAERLAELRANDPGGAAVIQWADETLEADRELLLRSLLFPDTAIASDATPLVAPGGAPVLHDWPVPDASLTHPRSTGCYGRTFGWLVRELGVLSLPEAVHRCTLVPARILEEAVPSMRRKARVQPGADADLVVFDPRTFAEQGDYLVVAPSTGVRHLLVGGQFVIADGKLDTASTAGRPIRSGQR
ncbi:amidohydrolase family protein [Amycolatopsis sp. NPDC058986]|uniref:amidohydrolase family protein n=1 Tax=unclassified Amycolatopsis TaxID=2618356 RepID=UPI003672E3A4